MFTFLSSEIQMVPHFPWYNRNSVPMLRKDELMPELPEVQTMVDDLNAAQLPGLSISGVAVFWPASISDLDVRSFSGLLTGRRILIFRRRGKYILAPLDSGWVMAAHLRMSGRFVLAPPTAQRSRHVQVEFRLSDGRRLWFHDTRKFGRFYLAPDEQTICGHLGVEPLSKGFSRKAFKEILSGSRRQLKPLLLDQTVIAGLGNIYVDEALWAAAIHPLRPADSLSTAEVQRLHDHIRRVLRQGLNHAGTSLGSGRNNFSSLAGRPGGNAELLKAYHRTGLPCLRCSTPMARILVGQRSTHFCPHCQSMDGNECLSQAIMKSP
jgi:formamidopyrimidine-DNA glycosylase